MIVVWANFESWTIYQSIFWFFIILPMDCWFYAYHFSVKSRHTNVKKPHSWMLRENRRQLVDYLSIGSRSYFPMMITFRLKAKAAYF